MIKKYLLSLKSLAFYFSLLITATLNAQTTYTATNMKVMDTLTSYNVIKAEALTTSDTLRAKDHVVAEQDVKVEGSISVSGNLLMSPTSTANLGNVSVTGDLRAPSMLFSTTSGTSSAGFRFLGTPPGFTGPVVSFGDLGTGTLPVPPCQMSAAPSNQAWILNNNGGYISSQQSGLMNASLAMYSAWWNGSSFIESQGTDQNGNPTALFLNFICGRDIGLCNNLNLANSGKVYVGRFLQAAQHVEIGDPINGIQPNNSPATNVALDLHVNTGKAVKIRTNDQSLSLFEMVNYGFPGSPTIFKISGDGRMDINSVNPANKMINLVDLTDNKGKFVVYGDGKTHVGDNLQIGFQNSAVQDANTSLNINNQNSTGIKFNTYNNSANLITVNNSNFSLSPFIVYGDGRTKIGTGKPASTGLAANAMLSVDGIILARDLYVAVSNTFWADYVFKDGYSLKPIQDLKKYVLSEKHLPGVPSSQQLAADGLSVPEMQKKQMEKVEELYLYIFQLKDEIDGLKKQLDEINKK